MQDLGYYAQFDYTVEEINEINGFLIHSRDFKLSYTEIKQIESKYAVKDTVNHVTFETPQFMYIRIALAVMEGKPKEERLKHIKALYTLLSKKKINPPSPNLSYIGTVTKTGASCCVVTAEDNIPSLAAANHVAYMMTVAAAGIGTNLQTRSLESGVRRNSFKHKGKLPYYRLLQGEVKANIQGSRGGACTTYFTCFDPELLTLITLRNPTSVDEKRIDGLDYALLYNNFFADKVAKNGDWMLVDHSYAYAMVEAFYSDQLDKFEFHYNEIFENEAIPKTIVKARDIALKFLTESYETGRFYDANAYEMNHHTPFKDPIYSSNLCVIGDTELLTDKGNIPIKDICGHTVKVWNGEQYSTVKPVRTGYDVEVHDITIFYKYVHKQYTGSKTVVITCTPYHKFYDKNNVEIRAVDLVPNQTLNVFQLPDGALVTPIVVANKLNSKKQNTYCVTEPLRNRVVFNGVLTGNCLEICLPTKPYHHIVDLYNPHTSEFVHITLEGVKEPLIMLPYDILEDADGNSLEARHAGFGLKLKSASGKICEVTDIRTKSEVALCNIGAIVLGNTKDDEYEDACYYLLTLIDYVILNSEYILPQVGYTAKKRMSAGVGITNLAYDMAKNGKYYSFKSGKQYLHEIAERHSYCLHKASLKIAKERGNAPWIHKTKYPEGWTPLDTYNANVDSIADFTLKYDWAKLKQEIIEQGGIAHSCLEAFMPCESSSLATNTTNGLYPIREGVIIKTDGANKNVFIAPDWDNLKDQYELAWEIPNKDMIETYAIFQKFCGQAISADYYYAYSENATERSLSSKTLLTDFLYRVKLGVKTKYYQNSSTSTSNEVSGCGSGGCSI